MIDTEAIKMAWMLLTRRERNEAWWVLAVMILSGLSGAAMVASVIPFLSVLSNPNTIKTNKFLSYIYQNLHFQSQFEFLIAMGSASLLIIAISTVLQVARSYFVNRFSMMRVHSVSRRLFACYLGQPYQFFLGRHTGDLDTKILSESQQVVNQFYRPFANAISSMFSVAFLVILLVIYNTYISFLLLGTLGLVYGLIYAATKNLLRHQGRIRASTNEERYRVTSESFGGIKQIKLQDIEPTYLALFDVVSRKMAWAQVIAFVVAEAPSFLLQGVAFGGVIVLALFLLASTATVHGVALDGVLPILGVFAFAGQRLIPELQRVYSGFAMLQYGAASVRTVSKDIYSHEASIIRKNSIDGSAIRLTESLQLRNVSFSYPGANNDALSDVNLEISKGQVLGVVGSTGSGKSTLADIILGLNLPTRGGVFVDRRELQEPMLHRWRKSVAYVPQEIFVTDGTIAENVAFGLKVDEIDMDRVQWCCKVAQLEDFIYDNFGANYNSTVGQRGVRLSGGQRQRIGIARALYRDSDLMLFDEATSALDTKTERNVIEEIHKVAGNRTIIMIAHRLSTLKVCDKIVVLENGRLVGYGPWNELLKTCDSFISLLGTNGRPEISARETNTVMSPLKGG